MTGTPRQPDRVSTSTPLRARRGDTEAARRRPHIFVDTAQMLPVMYAVASILILVTLLTLYADIVDPISLNG